MPAPIPSSQPASAQPSIRSVEPSQVFIWLARGWADLRRAGWLSLVHGVALAGFGAVLLWLARDRFWLLAGSFSGFLVIAPVLATSLYAISRALEKGEPVNLRLVIDTWMRWQASRFDQSGGYWSLVRFGVLLGLAATGWVITSAGLINVLSGQSIHSPADFLRHVVLAPQGHVFELWVTMGGLLAAPMFASSVITMPLLLDRRIDVLPAVLASWQVVLLSPVSMALWAAVLLLLTMVGMGTALLGLVVVIPVLGHASWHAYRDLVDASALAERLGSDR